MPLRLGNFISQTCKGSVFFVTSCTAPYFQGFGLIEFIELENHRMGSDAVIAVVSLRGCQLDNFLVNESEDSFA
jgi:hypothetical protein